MSLDLMCLKFTKRYIFLLTVLVTIGGVCVQRICKSYTRRMVLNKLRKCKQKQRIESKGLVGEELRNSFDHKDVDKGIYNMSMEELITYLRANADNYKIVFRAFQSKALHEDQRLNCVVEFVKLDVSDVNLDGPLAGMPVSVKDNILIKGYESYVGCSTFLNKPKPKENCVLITVLRQLGAIPFVKSTVPQTMMTIFSSNPVDGMTKNPQNINFIPGGSSSGEGALVGAKASILGFGSDIGGSVRIPAAFCGVVGFKPTVDRISMRGGFTLGIHSLVRSAYGPICRDVTSCTFIMRTIFNSGLMSKYDQIVPAVPFNDEDYNLTKLKIGYFTFDDSFHVMPAMSRAVTESVNKLRSKGHEVVPWKPPRCGRKWLELFIRAISTDGCDKLKTIVKDDKIDDALKNKIFHLDFSVWTRIYNYLKYMLPDRIVDADEKLLYNCCNERLSALQCNLLMNEIESFKRELIDDWTTNELDVVLCPAGGFTALPLKSSAFFCPLLTYIFLWNLVNFPAGTVPVTKVKQEDLDEMSNNVLYRSTKVLNSVSKDQMGTANLSVSVQCVALPWREELCLNLMKQLE